MWKPCRLAVVHLRLREDDGAEQERSPRQPSARFKREEQGNDDHGEFDCKHGGGSVHQQDNPLQMIRALMDDWMEANGRSSLRDVRHYFDTDYLFS